MTIAWPLSALLLVSCVGLPDQYHVFGTWDEGSDIDGWHGNPSIGDSYGVMVGVSGPIFSDCPPKRERREEVPVECPELRKDVVQDKVLPVTEPPPASWWKDTSFLGWIEKLAVGIVVLLTGRYGEDVVRKGAAKVKEMQKDKTTPSP